MLEIVKWLRRCRFRPTYDLGGLIGGLTLMGLIGLISLSGLTDTPGCLAKVIAPAQMIATRVTPTRAIDDELLETARGTFGVLAPVSDAEQKDSVAQLGQALFWDTRLSANGQIACASCHLVEDGGADRRRFSVDAKDRLTKRHSQTVFNATLQPRLRWGADRQSAAEQAEKSLSGSMGFREAVEVLPLLEQHGYAARFETAFPHAEVSLTTGHYAQAIAAYEQTLRTPSVFDQYLEGEADVLNESQRRGLRTFLEIGCADCHAGPLLGGEQLQKFGVHRDYWLATSSEQRDAGRFESTQEPADRNVFRVPMLRNIARTAPYFHDGSVAELEQAVRVMADVQLGLELTAEQTGDLVAFLQSLSGGTPANYQDPQRQTGQAEGESKVTAEPWSLEIYGTMREAIGLGQNQGRVTLGPLIAQPHLYAVGAVAGLGGEITILDGHAVVSTVGPTHTLVTLEESDAATTQATLLMGARVPVWDVWEIPRDFAPADLENYIEEMAIKNGINVDEPFPFLVEGKLLQLHAHVINGACPVHSRRNQLQIPVAQQPHDLHLDGLTGKVVGFFATNAAGRMTHPGTRLHAHVIYNLGQGETATGHLETWGVQAGATLRLPRSLAP